MIMKKNIINLLIDWKSFKEYSYDEELTDFKINNLFYTSSNEEVDVVIDYSYKKDNETVSEKTVILTGDNKNEVNKLYARQIYNNYNNAKKKEEVLYYNILESKEKNMFYENVIVEDVTIDKIRLFEKKLNKKNGIIYYLFRATWKGLKITFLKKV